MGSRLFIIKDYEINRAVESIGGFLNRILLVTTCLPAMIK